MTNAKTVHGYYEGSKLLPTPAVGDRVWWFDNADKTGTPVAADVVLIEAPGRVALKLQTRYPCRKTRGNDCLDGVRHVGDECHVEPNANTRDRGGWDWHRNQPPADCYDYHKNELERKAMARLIEEEQNEKRMTLRKEMAPA